MENVPPCKYVLSLLGRFELSGPEGVVDLASRKAAALLAFLACTAPEQQQREKLTELLWGSHFEAQARQNLRQTLFVLRRILGDDSIVSKGHFVSFKAGVVACDVSRFEALIRDGSRDALAAATELHKGHLLADLDIAQDAWREWLTSERQRLQGLALDAMVRLGELELASGKADAAARAAERAIAQNNVREDAHRLRIRALAMSGRRPDALRHYEHVVALLKSELNVEPDAATNALARELRKPTPGSKGTEPDPPPADRATADGEGASLPLPDRPSIARRGYLFAAPVTEIEHPSGQQIAQASEQAGGDRSIDRIPADSFPDHHTGKTGAWPLHRYAAVIVAGLVIFAAAGAVWWWSGRTGTETVTSATPAGAPESTPELTRASIAVLPFDNLGGDSEGMGLGEALAEIIISSLSKIPKMFVIARNSAFTYKGKSVKVQTVSRELGVRYVLEGSVQRAGSRVRIAAQLIDAATGFHLWSETYDRDLDGVFALQDEITLSVVTALQIQLTQGDVARIRQRGTNNLRAWLLVNQSFEHLLRFTQEDNARARRLAEEAIALDPNYAEAYVRLGRTHLQDFHSGWVRNPAASLRRSIELAQQALKLDDTYPDTYVLLSGIYLFLKRHDDARLAISKALDLSPNHSLGKAHLGMILTYAGEPEAAINVFKEAMRLSPIYPDWFLSELARAYFLLGRYEQAIEALQRRLQHDSNSGEALILLAASESAAGRLDKAKAALDKFLAPRPAYTLRHYASGEFFKNPEDLNRVLEALRRAGLPE